jgi:sirohydrochlorin ferrochelatase
MTALIVFAHGSTIESANDAVRVVSAEMARRGGYSMVKTAFLDGGSPDLAGAVDSAAADGATRVIVLPYFLTLGLHLQRDLPALVLALEERHPGLAIEVVPPLDGHPGLVEILLDRARTALGETLVP